MELGGSMPHSQGLSIIIIILVRLFSLAKAI
jgi:hypothetical protein